MLENEGEAKASTPLLTIAQVAERLALSKTGVRDLCRKGQIPYIPIGRTWRVAVEDLEAFLAARRQEAAKRAAEARATRLGVGT